MVYVLLWDNSPECTIFVLQMRDGLRKAGRELGVNLTPETIIGHMSTILRLGSRFIVFLEISSRRKMNFRFRLPSAADVMSN